MNYWRDITGIRPLALQPPSSGVEMVTRRVHVPVRLPGGISLGLFVLKQLLQCFVWFYCCSFRAKCSSCRCQWVLIPQEKVKDAKMP